MTTLSILDLVRVTEDTDARGALDNARDVAVHAEAWGYRRIWVAEHHNMPGIASAATSVVVGHIAAGTKSIRVGAGGIMLPNHAPYVIAEQFGTLARLFPGRIDLGLGRAPGTDQLTLRALRRTPESAENFPQDVLEVQAFLAPAGPNQRIRAIPAAGTEVPLWILGSSNFGAMLAAELGLPYAFASHFAPELLIPALQIYRSRFKPSEQLERPYAMVGINIIAAGSDDEARRLATTQQMSFTNIFRGARGLSQPPIDDIEGYWSPAEKTQAMSMLARSIVGSPDTVRAGIDALIAETGADELMIVSDVYDHTKRLRSFELIAGAAGIARYRDASLEATKSNLRELPSSLQRLVVRTLHFTHVEWSTMTIARQSIYFGGKPQFGDGKPILLVPDFSSNLPFMVLANWLKVLGYRPATTGLSVNADDPSITDLMRAVTRRTGRKAVLVAAAPAVRRASAMAEAHKASVSDIVVLNASSHPDMPPGIRSHYISSGWSLLPAMAALPQVLRDIRIELIEASESP